MGLKKLFLKQREYIKAEFPTMQMGIMTLKIYLLGHFINCFRICE